jgi:hypothetical protein
VAANAEYLITGNLRHYPAAFKKADGAVLVVNAREFLSV